MTEKDKKLIKKMMEYLSKVHCAIGDLTEEAYQELKESTNFVDQPELLDMKKMLKQVVNG